MKRTNPKRGRSGGSLKRVVRARSDDFERYWKTWFTTDGRDEASRWMAKHIGGIVGEIEQLKRRVAKLERERPNNKLTDAGTKTL